MRGLGIQAWYTLGLTMKLSSAFASLAAFAVGAVYATSPEVLGAPYDGVKVLRVPTGASTTALDELISSLHLERWTQRSHPSSHIDVEVPADVLDYFVKEANAISASQNVTYPIVTMHEDLGESIRQETAGMFDAKDEVSAQGTNLSLLSTECSEYISSL